MTVIVMDTVGLYERGITSRKRQICVLNMFRTTN